MAEIYISSLSPGEAVLSVEKIQYYRELLARGEQLEPIHIYCEGKRKSVRDGNNRVRAFIEHYRHEKLALPSIPFVPGSASSPGSIARMGLKKIGSYYGNGERAFLKIPIADASNYEAMQKKVLKEILASTA